MLFKQAREIFIFTSKERNGILIDTAVHPSHCHDLSGSLALPLLLADREICDVSAWKEEAEKYYATIPLKAEPRSRNL